MTYIDSGHALADVCANQNHVVYGRRGCGKTLLLHVSAEKLPPDTRRVYLNCEDFKQHTFPNVLIEILEAIFLELERNLSGWFGRKKAQREIIAGIRAKLTALRETPDSLEEQVTRSDSTAASQGAEFALKASIGSDAASVGAELAQAHREKRATAETTQFVRVSEKLQRLNLDLPRAKQQLREFFALSTRVKAVFIQIDDFYHLRLADQPFVADYVHRLCKDLPMYFKIATLRHSSSLFIERDRQPIGPQERHDFLPIDIDFTFENFDKTERQLRRIFHEYGKQVSIAEEQMDWLFKGEGLRRLVVAGGGVPRDCLSIFLDAHTRAKESGDGRIGKDTVRLLSLETLENRIKDLKKDSQADQQDFLLRGIYAIREFCFRNRTNAFVVEEREVRDVPLMNELLYRLLDYRIIHAAASAFTHKTHQGTFRAFVIDVGCYGFWRKLEGKLHEIDVSEKNAKEQLRSAPWLKADQLIELQRKAPDQVEAVLKQEPSEE
ncbi:MAG: hypothetical protein V2A79_16215 [Planctomycetota bacterium]